MTWLAQARDAALRVGFVAGTVVLLVIAGRAVARGEAVLAIGIAGAAIVLGLTMLDPVAVPTLAVPALLVVVRVGGSGTNLSISDLALAMAFVPAVLLCHRPLSRPFATIVGLNAGYQFVTLLTLVANPYLANLVEWFHAWLLVSGALFVGWAIGAAGRGPVAVKLLMVGFTVIAVGTLATAAASYARGQFGPVYPAWPYPMHKNFAGTVLALGAVLVYLHPAWFGWRTRRSGWLLALLLVATAVTQSRQALLGLVVVFFLVVLWPRVDRRRSRVMLVIGAGALGVVGVMVQDQLQSGNRFNSTNQRLDWFGDAIDVWLTDPWLGVGLRWWYTDRFSIAVQPPNVELEVLTSVGVLGLIAFLALFGGAVVVLRRLDPAFGLMPAMVLIARFSQAQFDLFWTAVLGSLPWLIVGLALGEHARAEAAAASHERTRELTRSRAT